MWVQEGRVCPIISLPKSPVGLHWPRRWNWVCWDFFLLWTSWRSKNMSPETLQRRPSEDFCRRNNYCGTTTISRQEGDDGQKKMIEEEEWSTGNRKKGCRWWEKEEWQHSKPVVWRLHRRESLGNLESLRNECSWYCSVTARLILLPFWHNILSALTWHQFINSFGSNRVKVGCWKTEILRNYLF